MQMTVDQIREYLRNKIDNSWYYNARIDYGVSGRFLDAQAYGDKLQHLRIIWEEDGKRYASLVSWWTEYTAEQIYNIWMEEDEPEEIPAEPTDTQSIKFFWNGIKVDGEKKLIRCHYSLDSSTAVSGPCVTIYARDYSAELPGDLFAVQNGSDSYQDYFCTDKATLGPGHPLYPYARAAAIKAELRNEKYYRSDPCTTSRAAKMRKLRNYKQELEALPTSQPTAADVAEVHALNLAAETARIATEKEQEQKEREAVLCARINGRRYIEDIAAAHPIQEGAPVVTIEWSEHPAFYSWEDGELKLSVAAAEIVLRHYDEERAERNAAEGHGGYCKTSFRVEYTDADGELSTYTGRYDLGDNDGGLIAHIRAFAESYHDKRFPYHSEEDAAQISAIADFLEAHTAAGRVVSVSLPHGSRRPSKPIERPYRAPLTWWTCSPMTSLPPPFCIPRKSRRTSPAFSFRSLQSVMREKLFLSLRLGALVLARKCWTRFDFPMILYRKFARKTASVIGRMRLMKTIFCRFLLPQNVETDRILHPKQKCPYQVCP